MENANLKAAIAYSQRLQWAVFPLHSIEGGQCTCKRSCGSPGKHPRTQNGLKDATTNVVVIEKWFTMWPDSNIGVATGVASGFWALDVDRHGVNGFEALEQLTDHFGKLPDTVEAITGGDGSHLLFKHHEGIGNKADLLPGIDVRGEGGYIAVSPSKHQSGKIYSWELSSHPLEINIAEAPQWLLNMVNKPKAATPVKQPTGHWQMLMNGISEGGRNSAATSLAGHLFRRYVEPSLIVEIMQLWNGRNDPPLEQRELEIIINSIAGKELARRKGGK
ncbi:bifunctional DNA primase/polymerase [Planomicrobium sp. YIM 101495]|uniref:bifunctional DNA primase/polymerase n=1 Tax=Planomicrobium sp. YIM 101495 TaxID=2665160 RepID=UPI0012B890C6|nr:bifunctional DNA primase/polymerase [Planomicrobium sp. YIM 101495]MTD31838.1 DNA primase [Planomicrobium sp. YIM 101495]